LKQALLEAPNAASGKIDEIQSSSLFEQQAACSHLSFMF
jgi:hypothetical protein